MDHTHSTRPARPARPAVLPAPLVLPVPLVLLVLHTIRPAYAHCLRYSLYRVHHAHSGLLCVLYALSYSQAGKRGKTA